MFGLIASMIFVGIQIKQEYQFALSITYQARTNTTVEQSMAAISSQVFLNAAAKLYAGRQEDLTMQEAIAWEITSAQA